MAASAKLAVLASEWANEQAKREARTSSTKVRSNIGRGIFSTILLRERPEWAKELTVSPA